MPLCDTSSIDAIINAMPKAHLIGTLLPHASARSVVCGSVVCLPVHVYLLLGIYLCLNVFGEGVNFGSVCIICRSVQ